MSDDIWDCNKFVVTRYVGPELEDSLADRRRFQFTLYDAPGRLVTISAKEALSLAVTLMNEVAT